MKIISISFDKFHIYGKTDDGRTLSQSLLWYKKLKNATDNQRNSYVIGYDGIHWRDIDEDISFESFEYNDAEPSALQYFFLTHPEINIAEFAKKIGLNPTLLRNYINGFKTPSRERELYIISQIRSLGSEYVSVAV